MNDYNEFKEMGDILEKHLSPVPKELYYEMGDFIEKVMKEQLLKGYKIGMDPLKRAISKMETEL